MSRVWVAPAQFRPDEPPVPGASLLLQAISDSNSVEWGW